jgi:hypothetical protein
MILLSNTSTISKGECFWREWFWQMPDETISQVAPQKSAGLAAPPGLIIESPAMQDGHPVIQVAAFFGAV